MTAPTTQAPQRPGLPDGPQAPVSGRRAAAAVLREVQAPPPRLFAEVRSGLAAALFGAAALFAAVTWLVSSQPSLRLWGALAAGGYAAGAVIAATVPRRGVPLAVLTALAGAVVVPLGWLASAGLAQPEVGVIIRSAAMFTHTGTPYHSPAQLAAAHNAGAYDPYLPALIFFGLPRALLGGGLLTDPRLWFGLVFVITFATAAAVARLPRPGWWTALVTASPVIALPLATSGDDLPVLGLICLGLAVAGWGRAGAAPPGLPGWRLPGWRLRREPSRWRMSGWQVSGWQPVAAGLILGLAAAMKATAWPALVVALALITARQSWRAVTMFVLGVAGAAAAADGAVMVTDGGALVANTVMFPLGLAKTASPAASPLPGHLLATAWGAGHWADLALIAAAAVVVGMSLIVRPPRNTPAAAWRLALGLTVLFLLAPASRVGYFIYPLGLAAWLVLARLAGQQAGPETGRRPETGQRQPARSVEPVAADGRQSCRPGQQGIQQAAARLDHGY